MQNATSIPKEYVDFVKCLAAVSATHRLRASSAMAPFGLNPCESSIITCLALDNTVNTIRDIALYLRTSKSLVSRSAEHLRQMCYIRTYVAPDDRRILCLELMDKAQPAVETLKDCIETFIREVTKGIAPEELTAFKQTAGKLLRNVHQAQL